MLTGFITGSWLIMESSSYGMLLKLLSKGTQGKKVKQSQKANDKLRNYLL